MIEDENKATARRYSDMILTHQRYEMLDEFLAPDFVDHFGDRDINGADELIGQMSGMHSSFDCLDFQIVKMLAEDDMVAIHFEVPGIHNGSFAGIPATGREVVWRGIMLYRLADGKLTEGWGYWNVADVLAEIQTPASGDGSGSGVAEEI